MNYLCVPRHTDMRVTRPDERHRVGRCCKTCKCSTAMDHQNRPTHGRGVSQAAPTSSLPGIPNASLRSTRCNYVPTQSPPLFTNKMTKPVPSLHGHAGDRQWHRVVFDWVPQGTLPGAGSVARNYTFSCALESTTTLTLLCLLITVARQSSSNASL